MIPPSENDTAVPAETEQVNEDTGTSYYYKFRFRMDGREFTACSPDQEYPKGASVMIKVEHGYEPATIIRKAAGPGESKDRPVSFHIARELDAEELERFLELPEVEQEAYSYCQKQVEKLDLPMDLVRVEQFFNGSKIIFYFTAENRVDFRELVKVLVQQFRTRVEMRQIGVRHETQMLGGLGSCGRELCCSGFLNKFESVSIKMAKTQDLPLNPSKISGLCNRLLCCLTYEYDNYRHMKKGMPRTGKSIRFEDDVYKVIRQVPLSGTLIGINRKGEERIFQEKEWRNAEIVQKPQQGKGGGKKK
ncbi:PSP1 domain-containing protein [Desulfogranum japonicum]|uniref:PSP1 domain-containing protein n=1 Tax=Desulfogranum japonicum TaxID=231447 RepID=UPI0004291A41|nr:regulatory iron-sulfur-containing complex subunit RicT [Desulfogranum japonicum]